MMKSLKRISCIAIAIFSILIFCGAIAQPEDHPDKERPLATGQVHVLLDAWVKMWNTFDLTYYFSTE